jgi:hypothetical protein
MSGAIANPNESWQFINIQCGYDSGVDGGMWRVDVSTAQGPAGRTTYVDALRYHLSQWQSRNGCSLKG